MCARVLSVCMLCVLIRNRSQKTLSLNGDIAFMMSTYGHSHVVAIGYCDVSRLTQAACGQVDQEKKTLKMYNNNDRELIERFRKLKALYN